MAIFGSSDSISSVISDAVAKQQVSSKQEEINKTVTKFKTELLQPIKYGVSELVANNVNKITRNPWVLTCDSWAKSTDPKYIAMFPNPSNITWDFAFRKSMVKTVAGQVTFFWRDPTRGYTVFDEPTIEFTMQSGSLLPVMTTEGQVKEQLIASADRLTPNFPFKTKLSQNARAKLTQDNYTNPKGIEIFYKFLELCNVPQMNVDGNGEPNYIRLVLNTLLFPRLIIRGQFESTSNISWTESIDSPTSIEWKVKLVINKITPNIGIVELGQMLATWRDAGGSNGFITPPNEDMQNTSQILIQNELTEEEDKREKDAEAEKVRRELRSKEQSTKAAATKVNTDTKAAAQATETKDKGLRLTQSTQADTTRVSMDKIVDPVDESINQKFGFKP